MLHSRLWFMFMFSLDNALILNSTGFNFNFLKILFDNRKMLYFNSYDIN